MRKSRMCNKIEALKMYFSCILYMQTHRQTHMQTLPLCKTVKAFKKIFKQIQAHCQSDLCAECSKHMKRDAYREQQSISKDTGAFLKSLSQYILSGHPCPHIQLKRVKSTQLFFCWLRRGWGSPCDHPNSYAGDHGIWTEEKPYEMGVIIRRRLGLSGKSGLSQTKDCIQASQWTRSSCPGWACGHYWNCENR